MEAIFEAAAIVFSPGMAVLLLVGVAAEVVVGAMPGLTSTIAIGLLIPFTYTLSKLFRLHAASRHLLRVDVRRRYSSRSDEFAGNAYRGRDGDRRLCDGAERKGEPSTVDFEHSLGARRTDQLRISDLSFLAAGGSRHGLCCAGIFRAVHFRARRRVFDDRGSDPEGHHRDRGGTAGFYDRHRPGLAFSPVHIRDCQSWRSAFRKFRRPSGFFAWLKRFA